MPHTNLYQLYDTTAQSTAGPIMAVKKDGPAIREFRRILDSKDTLPGQYPEQFQLLKIGQQDEESGQIVSIIPEVIDTGASKLALQRENQ